jgi:hypothetical protein
MSADDVERLDDQIAASTRHQLSQRIIRASALRASAQFRFEAEVEMVRVTALRT